MNHIEIIYEDSELCVVCKPQGIDSEHMLTKLVSQQLGCDIYPAHRLDKDAGGLIVLAKTKYAAAKLSDSMQKGEFEKYYLAIVIGTPEAPDGRLEDYLYHDRQKNKSYVVKSARKGVKLATLEYKTVGLAVIHDNTVTLLRIKLHTGRTHQIRVQFASRKLPLLGDVKYGGRKDDIKLSLWSHEISFNHPISKKRLEFRLAPPDLFPWNVFTLQYES